MQEISLLDRDGNAASRPGESNKTDVRQQAEKAEKRARANSEEAPRTCSGCTEFVQLPQCAKIERHGGTREVADWMQRRDSKNVRMVGFEHKVLAYSCRKLRTNHALV